MLQNHVTLKFSVIFLLLKLYETDAKSFSRIKNWDRKYIFESKCDRSEPLTKFWFGALILK